MIWYGVEIRSVPALFWKTVCDIGDALDNINFPMDETELMQLVNNWSAKHKDGHGFTTNMGTALAVDGVVTETVKPDAKHLNGQEVACYQNWKGVWGVISQVDCDANAKVPFVQTNWPDLTNDLSCFCETPLFFLLRNQQLPHWMHIIADKAYSPLYMECNGQILMPFS